MEAHLSDSSEDFWEGTAIAVSSDEASLSNSSIHREVTDAEAIPALDVYFDKRRTYVSSRDFDAIRSILLRNAKTRLAETPRLFWILRKIGRADILADLIAQDISDMHLPMFPPAQLTEPEQNAFVATQKVIFVRDFLKKITQLNGAHYFIEDDVAHLRSLLAPYNPDGTPNVRRHIDLSTQRRVTFIRYPRNSHKGRRTIRRATIRLVEHIKLLSSISHPHCGTFLGSTSSLESMVIFNAGVDDSLLNFLRINLARDDARLLVQSWFGCLASAMLYLHNNNIWYVEPRSKPSSGSMGLVTNTEARLGEFRVSNILIYNGKVSFPTTEYSFRRTTRRAQNWANHKAVEFDKSEYGLCCSDILGLGTVFMDMILYLFSTPENDLLSLSRELQDYKSVVQMIAIDSSMQSTAELLQLTKELLNVIPTDRPTANQVVHRLRIITKTSPQWCGDCCLKNLTDDDNRREGLRVLMPQKAQFTASDIEIISRRLTSEQLFEWSTIPRTYIVLSLIDRLDLMSNFIKSGLSDILFPYPEDLLRKLLHEPRATKEFFQQQEVVLSKESDIAPHHNHVWSMEERLDDIEELGSGGYGTVWHVFDPVSKQHLAKKLIRRVYALSGNKAKIVADAFEREITVLRRVTQQKHRHLVAIVGSWSDLRDFGILLSPLADMNLHQYMREIGSSEDMEKWFGCLAVALDFLHGMKIRHKDIKPQNILVHGKNILLTDFGISNDWTDATGPTTSGPGARDVRYCAPEVADYDKRNESADLYSLGCVFLEMFSVLEGFSISDIRKFFELNSTGATQYHQNPRALELWIFDKLIRGRQSDVGPTALCMWISRMVPWRKEHRITSAVLVDEIIGWEVRLQRAVDRDGTWQEHEATSWCGECCFDSYVRSMNLASTNASSRSQIVNEDYVAALRASIAGPF